MLRRDKTASRISVVERSVYDRLITHTKPNHYLEEMLQPFFLISTKREREGLSVEREEEEEKETVIRRGKGNPTDCRKERERQDAPEIAASCPRAN